LIPKRWKRSGVDDGRDHAHRCPGLSTSGGEPARWGRASAAKASPDSKGCQSSPVPSVLPLGEQIRTVNQVLIEDITDPSSQLIPCGRLRHRADIRRFRLKEGCPQQRRQQSRRCASAAPPCKRDPPQEDHPSSRWKRSQTKRPGKRELQVGGYARGKGDLSSNPMRHALVVHHDNFWGQRIRQVGHG
jgi:hypothetical protein